MPETIYLTFDVDWAAEPVVAHVLERLDRFDARATIFATHRSSVLMEADRRRVEIALHPNYFEQQVHDPAEPVTRLKEIYPEAVGARSHGLFTSSRIISAYARAGLRYESNIFLYRHARLKAVWRFRELASVPFLWSDDKHLELCEPLDFRNLPINVDGLKVLNFHPIHVFINSESEARYATAKRNYKDMAWLRSTRNSKVPGMADVLDGLLEWIRANKMQTGLLRDIRVDA